jgi:zinc finger protein
MENKKSKENSEEESIQGEECPFCHAKALTLMEAEKEIPYFGKVLIFSMSCSECKYHKADVECVEKNDPVKYTLEISSEADMNIRIVKSSEATITIPHITKITPGPASNGYITNVEGVLNRVKHQLDVMKDSEEEKEDQKKARNMIKKLNKVMWGQEKLKIIIEDPTGNSAIISEKAQKSKP